MNVADTGGAVPTDGSGEARIIPEATVVRLPVYRRILEELERSGIETVSSELLASVAHVGAAKVRKDLSYLGSFGRRGSGYEPKVLMEQIDRQLGLDRSWPIVIAGVGNLGRALANSRGFAGRSFTVAALIDTDPAIIGSHVAGVEIRHFDDLAAIAEGLALSIGVITTPETVAQHVADLFVGVGIRSILNFSPQVLEVPLEVQVRYVDLSMELQVMSFYQVHSDPSEHATRMPILRSIGTTGGSLE